MREKLETSNNHQAKSLNLPSLKAGDPLHIRPAESDMRLKAVFVGEKNAYFVITRSEPSELSNIELAPGKK